jgi:hypothetical protein
MASSLGSVLIGKDLYKHNNFKLNYVARKYKSSIITKFLGLLLKLPVSLVLYGAHATCLKALNMDCVSFQKYNLLYT